MDQTGNGTMKFDRPLRDRLWMAAKARDDIDGARSRGVDVTTTTTLLRSSEQRASKQLKELAQIDLEQSKDDEDHAYDQWLGTCSKCPISTLPPQQGQPLNLGQLASLRIVLAGSLHTGHWFSKVSEGRIAPTCLLCQQARETLYHVFWECPVLDIYRRSSVLASTIP